MRTLHAIDDNEDDNNATGEENPVTDLWVMRYKNNWQCDMCYLYNALNVSQCESCRFVRPGHEVNTATTTSAPALPGTPTSVAPPPNTAGFSFGIPPQPAADLSLGAPGSEQSTVLGHGFHSAAAKLILKQHFETERGKLSKEDCILLSERTKLAPKQVKTWFRNRNHRKKGNKLPGTEE